MTPTKPPRTFPYGLAARAAISVTALAWLGATLNLGGIATAVMSLSAIALASSAALTLGVLLIVALRWGLLLRAAGLHLPARRVLGLTWFGFFVNTCLPGGIGGDVARGVAGAAGRPGLAAYVVILDKLFGLHALVLIAWVGTCRGEYGLPPWGLTAINGLAAALSVALVGALLLPAVYAPLRVDGPLWRWWARAVSVGLPLSIGSQLGVAASAAVLLRAAQPELAWDAALTLTPLAMLSQLVPVTLGGTGAREIAFFLLFQPLGVLPEQALAASLALYASYVLLSLPGALPGLGGAVNPEGAR